MASINAGQEDEVVWLLRHRTRRRIILAIGDAGKISATSLRDTLKISTGSLYYNLRQLRDFVAQDQDRNYVLTDEGMRVYKALKEKGTVSPDVLRPKPPGKLASALTNLFFPTWLYTPIYENMGLRILVPALSLAVSLALLIYTRTATLLLHIHQSQPNIPQILLRYLLTILALYVLITAFSIAFSGRLLHGKREGESIASRIREVAWSSIQDEVKFLLSLPIAILPLMFFPGVLAIDKLFQLGILPEPGTVLYFQLHDLLLIIAQALSLPFLTALTAYGRRLTGSTAALVILLIFFISHTINQTLITTPTA